MIDEFVAVWQWKPQGKLTEDELTLKSDGMLTLKSEGLAAAGTWNVTEPKGGGRNIVKINLSGSTSSIEMERISLTTLRALNGQQRAVLKDSLDDCLYVEYFEFPEGLAGFQKPPPLLGRKPDLSRSEQQIDWVKSELQLAYKFLWLMNLSEERQDHDFICSCEPQHALENYQSGYSIIVTLQKC